MTRSEHIIKVLDEIGLVWKERPDLTLMELISDTHADAFSPRFWSDDKLVEKLKKMYEVKE